MTFFRRLRRLRRPIAVLLLVCATSFFVLPVPSPALEPVTVATVGMIAAGAASIYARNPAAYNQMFARAGNWVATRGQGLATTLGTFASAGADKLIGFMGKAKIGMGNAFKWIKNHPADAADIAGTIAEAGAAWYGAMNNAGLPLTANALRYGLGGGNTVPKANELGDRESRCGEMYVLVEKRLHGVSCCTASDPGDEEMGCGSRRVWLVENHPSCTTPCTGGKRLVGYDYIYQRVEGDQPETSGLPDSLTPDQEQRLLDKIGEYLDSQKDQMERELDELLKKNLNDIDWPKFDSDAAKKYLDEQRGQQLQDKIDDLQDEIERRKQERENCQQTGNCTNQCVDQCCEDSRLADRLDQLKDRLDDLNQRQEDDAVNEYDPPVVTEVELKQIDFQPIVDLKGELMTKFPFNMLQAIPSAVQLLTAEPQAPYFDVNLGIGGVHRVDFAVFDGVASFIRLVLTFLIYIGAVFCCLKIWSRF